jgi:hypothetical protein
MTFESIFVIHGFTNEERDDLCRVNKNLKCCKAVKHATSGSRRKVPSVTDVGPKPAVILFPRVQRSLSVSLQNFATADRPRCMLRDETYSRNSRQFRGYDYGTDEYEQTQWHWNMNHQPNGDAINGKKSQPKSKHAHNSSRSSASSSGIQSFFRWFKRDEKSRGVNDIAYPRDITGSTDTLEFESKRRLRKHSRRKLKAYDSNDNISPPSSPRFSRAFSQSSSCDSVFSTASSFAFVPPVKYLSNRHQKQVKLPKHRRKLAINF